MTIAHEYVILTDEKKKRHRRAKGEEMLYDVAVIGGGIAGYSAALCLKNKKANYLWLGVKGFGEKLRASEYVRNYPAFLGDGTAFSSALQAQKQREEVVLTEGRADGVYAMGDHFVITVNKQSYSARSVILATGVETGGNLKGEREFLGRGVSYCAVCDGALYKGKDIAVVISAKEYEEEIEYLSKIANTVYVFPAYKNFETVLQNVVKIQAKPTEIKGKMRVEEVIAGEKAYPVSGVFFLRNATPPSALCGGLETEGAHVKTNRDGSTNLEGLFAAGDVTGTPYQFVKAAGEGLVAAFSAHAYALKQKRERA